MMSGQVNTVIEQRSALGGKAMRIALGLFCLCLAVSLTSLISTASGTKTRVQLPTAENSVPGSPSTVPAFATLQALDEYYNAADSGHCDDNCLASLWLKLATEGKVPLLDDGTTVWLLRRQTDPGDSTYHVCRVLYY